MVSSRSASSARRSVRVQCSARLTSSSKFDFGRLSSQEGRELAVDLEVGIAADRRGEVAIILARQRVMAFGLRRVDRLLEAPEQAEVDGVCLGLVGRLGEDALELEPALGVLDLDAEAAGEVGEVLELARLGVGVDPAEEPGLGGGQVRGDGLVGGEHELLDDLVAHVVRRQVGAHDLPLFAQVDLDLGHVQLQRPPLEPTRSEEHGQLEHLGDHRPDLGVEAGASSPSGCSITSKTSS